jgi:undecaprenyl diphosphate synthase
MMLMNLFSSYLQKEVDQMEENGVKLVVVGDKSKFSPELQTLIRKAELQTQHNTKITLRVAANYGGRWDVIQATKAWQAANPDASIDSISEEALVPYLSTGDAPEMDLVDSHGWRIKGEQLHACGRLPMPSSFSLRPCGPISPTNNSTKLWIGSQSETGALGRRHLFKP